MRTLLSCLVVLLTACGGTWLPDVPPPAARQSPTTPHEVVFQPSKAQLAALWSSTLEHTAWLANGQVHWLSASGRGSLPAPSLPLWDVDAVDGQGWALTSQLELVRLPDLVAVPAPPAPLRYDSRVHAFERDVLIVITPFRSESEKASVCVFRAAQWSCFEHASTDTSVFPDGRDPGSQNDFLFHELDGVTRVDFRFELPTGRITRLGSPSSARALESGVMVPRDGRPPLLVTWTVTQVRVGCFDAGDRLLPVCTREGPVTELVFSEVDGEVVREVAHAHVDANVKTLRRHGAFLVSFDIHHGAIITLP